MADYIDREELLEKIVNVPSKVTEKTFYDKEVDLLTGSAYRQNEIEDIVNDMPTVEQKHGHWIEELASQHGNAYDGRTWTKYKKYRCSYCRITNGNRRPDYCPHCGAKMRGDG